MTRKAWIAFVVVQLPRELGPWAGLRMKSSLGPALWVAGMVLMMPGRPLRHGEAAMERRPYPLYDHGALLLIEVRANLLVWLLCAYVFRSLHNRHVGKAISPTTSL